MENKTKIDIYCKVDSSMIKNMHFNSTGHKGNLGVTFTNGSSYIYGNVRLQSFLNVLASTSIGQSFNKYIVDSYAYKKVDDCGDESPLIRYNMI